MSEFAVVQMNLGLAAEHTQNLIEMTVAVGLDYPTVAGAALMNILKMDEFRLVTESRLTIERELGNSRIVENFDRHGASSVFGAA